MSAQRRPVTGRLNLRYLKLEAKRRRSAGEFTALHEAQLAIAREHGLPSWAALKGLIDSRRSGPALAQVRWVISRFRAARAPTWRPPAESELREHFGARFLASIPPDRLITGVAGMAAGLREDDLTLDLETPLAVRAAAGDLQIQASVEAEPPYRLIGLQVFPVGARVSDPRRAESATRTSGEPPGPVADIAAGVLTELGLPGLALAGASRSGCTWAVARGWADLDRNEPLTTAHRFPAYQMTMLVTAVAVLRLAADGVVGLDRPAGDYLHAIRLAGDEVTVRELMTHTGGAVAPGELDLLADSVPSLASVLGPELACGTDRGVFRPSPAGYAVLGQLIADVTGLAYPQAAARLVLGPLRMTGSSFPERWPDTDAVTGYRLTHGGQFEPVERRVCTLPAAGGLWTTASDLARFGATWTSLLPAWLAREATAPQAARPVEGGDVGLGWMLSRSSGAVEAAGTEGVAGHVGEGPGGSASLIVRVADGQACAALTSRLIPIEPANGKVLRATAAAGGAAQ
jgi:CubicO group peptidase (beta-lactamase class C family)